MDREAVSTGTADTREFQTTSATPIASKQRTGILAAVVVGAIALLPRLLTVGHFYNTDEWLWMARSDYFSNALMQGDLAHMSATQPVTGTVPGIPTVWLGTLARWIWEFGSAIGVVDPGQMIERSASAYTVAQVLMAITTATLIGLIVWLVVHWLSTRVAVLAGVVLATEPFWVSLGSIVHTDELVALFGLAGLVALAWALELPAGIVGPRHPRFWAVVAAVALTLSALTKLSGLLFGPPALAMIVWAVVASVRAGDTGPGGITEWKAHLGMSGWMILAAVITIAVSYPALVVDPVTQWHAFRAQWKDVGTDRRTYFLGEVSARPGVAFYPVTLAYQSSAWFFVLAPVGVAVALIRRVTRRFALLILGWVLVPCAGLLTSSLSYPRYGLMVLGPLTLAAACAAHSTVSEPRWWANHGNRLVAGGAAAMFLASVWVAPWGGVTFNPIMTAYRKPFLVMAIGWGEPVAVALPIIDADAREHGRTCAGVSVAGLGYPPSPGDCITRWVGTLDEADYAIVQAIALQQGNYSARTLQRDFDLISVGRVADQPLVEVWRRKAFGAE